jgi:hypothetical protein
MICLIMSVVAGPPTAVEESTAMFSESTDRGTMSDHENIEPLGAVVDLNDAEYRRTWERITKADWSASMVSAFNSSI